MQISSNAQGCLNTTLTLQMSEVGVPSHLSDYSDGYTSTITADVRSGFDAYSIQGVCFEHQDDATGTFCYRVFAGQEDNVLQDHYLGYWSNDTLEAEINDYDDYAEYGYVDEYGNCFDDMGFELYCHMGIKGWGDFWRFEPATIEVADSYEPAAICSDPAACSGFESLSAFWF